MILEIGFRLAEPGRGSSALRLEHTPHHERMFEEAFSSDDDGVIADALSVWIVDDYRAPPGWCVQFFSRRVESGTPFSPMLRRVCIRIIERTWSHELRVSGLVAIRFLDRLEVDVDDVGEKREWPKLLVNVIRSPMGPQNLSSHYWRLLDKLVLARVCDVTPASRDTEVMRSLEEAGDWERLEVWMVIVWRSLRHGFLTDTESMNSEDESVDTAEDELMDAEAESMGAEAEQMDTEDESMDVEDESTDTEDVSMSAEDVRQVTLRLLLQRPSALPRFEALCRMGRLRSLHRPVLRRICAQARAEQLPLGTLPLP